MGMLQVILLASATIKMFFQEERPLHRYKVFSQQLGSKLKKQIGRNCR